jgi:hypothetical protein
MAHKTRIGGTNYNIVGGKTKIQGTGYNITGGKTRIQGTGYNISFAPPPLTIEQLFASVTGVFPKNYSGREIRDIPASAQPYYVFALANGYCSITEITCDGSSTTILNTYGTTNQSEVQISNNTSAARVSLNSAAYNYCLFALQFSANNDSIANLLTNLTHERKAGRMVTGSTGGSVYASPFAGYAFVHGVGQISSSNTNSAAFAVDTVTSSGQFTNIYSLGYKNYSSNYGVRFTVTNPTLLRYNNTRFYVSQNGTGSWSVYGASIIQLT